MKFGQILQRNQVPEWASSYIDYKALKKLIKAAAKESEDGSAEPDLAEFFYTLDRQLENVDTFYNRKYAELSRRLRLLYDRYGMASKLNDGMEKEDMEDLMGTLLELRSQYRNLNWYGDMNKRGFVKITKKLDKKIASSTTQSRYLATKVDPKPFATSNKLTLDLRSINEWLSSLAEVKVVDDSSSIHSGSSGSIHRMGSKASLRIPSSALDAMEQATREDNTGKVFELVSAHLPNATNSMQKGLYLDLLQRAITFRSMACIEALISKVPSIDPDDDMNKRNCLHRLVIATGRARASENSGGYDIIAKATSYINAAEPPVRAPGSFKVEERDPDQDPFRDEHVEKLLKFILDHLSEQQRPAVLSKDTYGRSPLHYAAQYGLVFATQILMKHMQKWQLFDVSHGIDAPEWQDDEGYAPLHLAVIGGHYRTSRALLLVEDWHEFTDARLTKHGEKSGLSLELATKSNYHKIVKLLVDVGVDVNFKDAAGETALHIAARFGFEGCARALLDSKEGDNPIDIEIAENTYGWTPLFIACVNGHQNIAQLLIDAGAEVNKLDTSRWTPKEHAALRGHLKIANMLATLTPPPSEHTSPELAAQISGSPPNPASLEDRRSNGLQKDDQKPRIPEPVKSFGHGYLKEESMVLVSLGTLDEKKDLKPISLENIAIADAHATQLDTALSLVVSAQGATCEPTVIDLPIQEEISTSPITFTTKNPSKVKLTFDLVPTYSGSHDKRIARAVALLSSIKPGVGDFRMSLQTDLSVPLLAGPNFDIIGSINFNFLIITPMKKENLPVDISEEKTYWTKSATQVIGHRGLGKNFSEKRSLQLGENTIQSFVTAANLGASYVEFDVQMTKDLHPVIYHDFLVSETGADVPVHTLTLDQFLSLSNTPKPSPPEPPPTTGRRNGNPTDRRLQRSYSLGAPAAKDEPNERMKHTLVMKEGKKFKGNTRGMVIHSQFTTLEEMFHKLPDDVGFNIEMKYPMLFETRDEQMDTYAIELNTFVDKVLEMVYAKRKKRNIVFSSFHPDICLLLRYKQPSIPVMFLTDAGASEVGDIRASSLQEAIRFASRWQLLGIVSAAEPFVLCPRLIKVVQSSGLICMSYGTLNNEPVNSNLQARAGIDAVIVDSVARVRKGLTEAEAPKNNNAEVTRNGTSEEGVSTLTKDLENGLELAAKAES